MHVQMCPAHKLYTHARMLSLTNSLTLTPLQSRDDEVFLQALGTTWRLTERWRLEHRSKLRQKMKIGAQKQTETEELEIGAQKQTETKIEIGAQKQTETEMEIGAQKQVETEEMEI